MRKFLVFMSIFLISMTFVYAGPFGLSNGMSLEEVTNACDGRIPQRIENDDRYLIEPEKSHSMFKYYVAWISEDYGLYYIRALSDAIKTNDYGEEIKSQFYSFKDRVERIYGKPVLVDKITDPETVFKSDSDWLYSLQQGARQLYAEWDYENKKVTLKDDLYYVRLWAAGSGYKQTQLIIDYGFINHGKVQNQEDDVL